MWIVQRIPTLLVIVYVCISFGYAQINNDCGLQKFRCSDGQCIAAELLCDGKADCRDSSDETVTACEKAEFICPHYAFRCDYGACVDGNSICDGKQDCVDNSDESQSECSRNTTDNQTVRPLQKCNLNDFACNNGVCITIDKVCDGYRDCADGSDEVSTLCSSIQCFPTAFRCNYGACIDGDKRCDGIIDCVDGSDENSRCTNRWPSPLPTIPTQSPLPTIPTQSPTPSHTCRAPPQPQNGHWKLDRSQCSSEQECNVPEGAQLGLGSHLIYSCNSGYKIRGPVDVSCSIGGKWLNIPVCIEIRCRGLTTASVAARCTHNDEWISCESPVPPRTKAELECQNSYQPETTLLSGQTKNVRCNANGQWQPEPMRCIPECGILPPDIKPTIVGGKKPNITEFPWHASMYRGELDGTKTYFCGASIIKENLLITAAHCVFNERTRQLVNASEIYILAGNFFRDYDYPFHNSILVKSNQVKRIYIIRNYLGLIGNYLSDIAILELVRSFVLSTWLIPVCIDIFSDRSLLEVGSYGKVAGFGRTATGDSSAVLQALTVPVIAFSQCKSASQSANTEQYITNDKFCAGYTNGSSVCDGDSGGGLVFKNNKLWYLRGIVSVSLGTIREGGNTHCDNNLYSLYTDISRHISWIQDVIIKIEQNQDALCSIESQTRCS